MSKQLQIHLITIDPQKDFLGYKNGTPYTETFKDGTTYTADLPVFGAVEDMDRLAAFTDKYGHKIADWHVTMDSHHELHLGHAQLWQDSAGKHPPKFTIISAADIKAGTWTPVYPSLRQQLLDYAVALEATPGHYRICIWSDIGHCLIGTTGHTIYAPLRKSMQRWCLKQGATIDFVPKGSNWRREHYGALMAEVYDPEDPTTGLNTPFLENIAQSDITLISGEASSHCTLKTLDQMVQYFAKNNPDILKKLKTVTDAMSPVGAIPGLDFPKIASDFYLRMEKDYGVERTTTLDFFN